MSEVTNGVRVPGAVEVYEQAPGPAARPIAASAGVRRLRSAVAAGLTMILAVLGGVLLAATPAQAAAKTPFKVGTTDAGASGNLIWHNRSVQVGGGVWGGGEHWSVCGAVVFTAYDKDGKRVARKTRPDDGVYNCSPVRQGYGFMLDADTVYGGIRTVRVDLWSYTSSSTSPQLVDTQVLSRP